MLTLIPDFNSMMANPELDSVVTIAKTFQSADQPFELMFIHDVPDLTRLLYQARLDTLPWWNVFDDIQAIERRSGIPLMLDDLDIPPRYDRFSNGPYVRFYDHGQLRITVELHPAGFVWRVTLTDNDGQQVDQYDTRGFRRWRQWQTAGGDVIRQEWYRVDGTPVMTANGHGVTIYASESTRFQQSHYDSVQAVVHEVITRHLRGTQDLVILPWSAENANWRAQVQVERRFAWLATRVGSDTRLDVDTVAAVDTLVFPLASDRERFVSQHATLASQTQVISLYPTTLDLGQSNEVDLMEMYWHVGDVGDHGVRALFNQLLDMLMADNDRVLVAEATEDQVNQMGKKADHFVEGKFGIDAADENFQQSVAVLKAKASGQPLPVSPKKAKALREMDNWSKYMAAFSLRQRVRLVTDTGYAESVGRMQTARIFVDTSKQPDLRLQTLAVSTGIPQVTTVADDLVQDGRNGRVVDTIDDIPLAIRYFVDTLRHWNEAAVANMDLVEQQTVDLIYRAWKELI